ncbi:hypothetical protein NPIL_577721 [Nephila pilipes]|uniref:Uncharacterized protein n=1 Tax=Nephila pilipes TaxID=299642 RepID=A0A8X6R1I0_NEPPI|nr:hypothetical protein NPIL_577721 [Nephila pilipes]
MKEATINQEALAPGTQGYRSPLEKTGNKLRATNQSPTIPASILMDVAHRVGSHQRLNIEPFAMERLGKGRMPSTSLIEGHTLMSAATARIFVAGVALNLFNAYSIVSGVRSVCGFSKPLFEIAN